MSSVKLAPKIKLSNGLEMPIIGLGTWKSKPSQVYEAVKCAIQCGYRHIDCALAYENETEVGNAIREKIDDNTITRKDLFVTAKAWNTFHRREKVIDSCKKSLKDLQLNYVDLFLIHWPVAFKEGDDIFPTDKNNKMITENIDFTETWKGMESCYEKGLVKAIGLSNFNSKQIRKILDVCKIKPVMLQVECHPYLNENKLIKFCKGYDIAVTAYSPLGGSLDINNPDAPNLLKDERIEKLAAKYNKTPAQILLRFNVQRGVVVIPKSVTKERIISNFNIFDFELSQDEMITVENFQEKYRTCHLDWLKDDINYPFNIEY